MAASLRALSAAVQSKGLEPEREPYPRLQQVPHQSGWYTSKNADAIPKAKSIGHTSISQSPTILTRQYLQRHMNTMPLWIKDWRCLQLDQQPDQGSAD